MLLIFTLHRLSRLLNILLITLHPQQAVLPFGITLLQTNATLRPHLFYDLRTLLLKLQPGKRIFRQRSECQRSY